MYYLYDNGQHGLIADITDQSIGIEWYNGTYKYMGTTGDGVGGGVMNTAMIIAAQMADIPTGNFAAKVCAEHIGSPSILMRDVLLKEDRILKAIEK